MAVKENPLTFRGAGKPVPYGGKVLQKGSIWEFYNGTTDETRTYELVEFEDPHYVGGAICQLRNIETDGLAKITVRTLVSDRACVTGSVWRYVASEMGAEPA